MSKPFERSKLTQLLVSYIQPHEKGSQIAYREISDHAGFPIDSASHNLIYARKILEREFNQIWIPVRPKIGIRRLNDAEIAHNLGSWWMPGARRKLGRGGDQADVVEVSQLDINQQSKFGIDCIQRELAFESLSKATRRRMEKVARGTSNDLPSFNILEWAISLSPRKTSSP